MTKPKRGAESLLYVHVEVDDVGEHLGRRLKDGAVSLWRSPAALRAARASGRARRGSDVPARRRRGCPREASPRDLVVEPDTGPFGHYLAPEDVTQRLGRAHHIPLSVGHDEVCRVLLRIREVGV